LRIWLDPVVTSEPKFSAWISDDSLDRAFELDEHLGWLVVGLGRVDGVQLVGDGLLQAGEVVTRRLRGDGSSRSRLGDHRRAWFGGSATREQRTDRDGAADQQRES